MRRLAQILLLIALASELLRLHARVNELETQNAALVKVLRATEAVAQERRRERNALLERLGEEVPA